MTGKLSTTLASGLVVSAHTFRGEGSDKKAAISFKCRPRQRKCHRMTLEDFALIAEAILSDQDLVLAVMEQSVAAADAGLDIVDGGDPPAPKEEPKEAPKAAKTGFASFASTKAPKATKAPKEEPKPSGALTDRLARMKAAVGAK